MSRAAKLAHWFNTGFTVATISLDPELMLKVGAFLFVTLPLGYVQWVSAVEKWKERSRKRNGSS
jgi:hypothetical protein